MQRARPGPAVGSRERDRPHRLVERDVAEGDVGHPGAAGEVEEVVEEGLAQVEVDQHHPPAGPGERDGQVRDRRRLALLLGRARDHDRARLDREVGEVEVDAQLAVGLGLDAALVVEHAEAPGLAQRPRRDRDPGQERQAEPLGDVVGVADARVERLRQRHEDQADDQADAEAHGQVAGRGGPHLGALLRRLCDLVVVREGCWPFSYLAGSSRLAEDVVVRRPAAGCRLRRLLLDLRRSRSCCLSWRSCGSPATACVAHVTYVWAYAVASVRPVGEAVGDREREERGGGARRDGGLVQEMLGRERRGRPRRCSVGVAMRRRVGGLRRRRHVLLQRRSWTRCAAGLRIDEIEFPPTFTCEVAS